MRSGLWVSGAGGSGILVGRTEDGSWSPPSGIMLHTVGLGFLVGVDIYDCVVVINTTEALKAFSSIRCTLGGEVSAVAGPVGIGGVLETEIHKRQAPVFTYLKSRGFYAGVQMDGTIIIERTDENERFYGERISVKDILAGKARHPPYEIKKLMETIKSAQGDSDIDESLLLDGPPPGDYEVQQGDVHGEIAFGIPDKEDPDPYGVLALQNAGLEIREAGTHARPTSEQFEFNPSPTSPIYTTFRRSMDHSSIDGRSMSRRSSWRTSTISSFREPKTPTMVDMCTQTDFDTPEPIKVPQFPPPLPKRHSRASSRTSSPTLADIPELKPTEEAPPQQPAEEIHVQRHTEEVQVQQPAEEAPAEQPAVQEVAQNEPQSSSVARESKAFDEINLDDDEEEEEEPIIEEIHQAAAPQVITRARVVQVAKVLPPKLPPRNPFRNQTTDSSDSVHELSANGSPVAGHSPIATPSLKGDGSSASSLSSIEGLEHVHALLQPKASTDTIQEKDAVHSVPESPIKTMPGGF
jgi:lipid-binding SYLF domain-containing protein